MIFNLNEQKVLSDPSGSSVFKGEKDFNDIVVNLPDNIDGHTATELNYVMHFVDSDGGYSTKILTVDSSGETLKATATVSTNITSKAQSFYAYVLMTDDEETVIGKTNGVIVMIHPVPDEENEIIPPADADKIIKGLEEIVKDATDTIEEATDTIEEATAAIQNKQDKLTAGNNITISGENVISATDTTDYTELSNKPSINGVTLSGNKTSSDLGLQAELTAGAVKTSYLDDGAVTLAKLHSGVIDNTLSTQGAAAEAKAAGNEIGIAKNSIKGVSVPMPFPGRINPSGIYIEFADYISSDFIPINENSVFALSDWYTGVNNNAYSFYDINKSFISGANSVQGNVLINTIPQNAAFVRFCSANEAWRNISPVVTVSDVFVLNEVRNAQQTADNAINEIKADAALVAGESLITESLLEPYNATFTNVEYTTTANKTLMADGTIIDFNSSRVSNVVVLTPDTLYECNCAGIGGGGAYFFLYDKNDNISAIYPAIDTDSKNFVFKASDKFKKIQFNVRSSGCYLRAITLNGLEVENNFIELTNHILDTVDYTRLNISFIESKLLNDEGVVQDYAGGGTTWTVSNEIDISQYDYLKINARTGYGNAFFAIYDENHNPIYVEVSPNSAPSIYNANIILPENAHYLVISKFGRTFDAYVSYPVFEAPTKKWEGKKWVCIGDSLTEANSTTSKHYFDYIADETGITTANYGIGGTGYANPSGTAGNFTARMASVPTDADVYTIFGSFNDYAYSINNDIPIGTPEDSGTSTICGYINSAFDALFARVPLANLGVVAPCPWVSVNSVTGTTSKTFAENYVSALRQCCERRSIPFLDLYHDSGLRPWDSNFRESTYTKDTLHGVHPDETGHAILAPKFSAFLDLLLSVRSSIIKLINDNAYVLTAQDKSDIADIVLSELPTTQGVQYGN